MKLGGFYYKSGQKMASNMGGVVPKYYQDMYQPFLNDIPARSPADIRSVVEGELKQKMEDVFSSWEDKPIGCASIGQVHKATLKKNGQMVVVKVQNPEAQRTFNGDVFALKTIIDVFMPQLSVAFDEIQRQFATEFDYRGECKNAIEIRDNLKKAGFDDIIVPEVYPEYCSEKLMVMEEVKPSIPLHDVLDEQAGQMARQKGISKKQYIEEERTRMEELAKELAKVSCCCLDSSHTPHTHSTHNTPRASCSGGKSHELCFVLNIRQVHRIAKNQAKLLSRLQEFFQLHTRTHPRRRRDRNKQRK
jgi:hypothetical protein